jgi:ethanolamine ammonia-lyase small subunit
MNEREGDSRHSPDTESRLAAHLRTLTPARVGLGRTGVSLKTRDLLDSSRRHAIARGAVHAKLEPAALVETLSEISGCEVLHLRSAAADRAVFLQRPDLGRKLDERSRVELEQIARPSEFDLSLVVADGLSALAVERHAAPLIQQLMVYLGEWRMAPMCVVERGRVAICDEIGGILGARISVILIGERPGLSSPDSLGAYITWRAKPGRTDAERNCISNIRPEGLTYTQAAAELAFILNEARRLKMTGVALKNSARQLLPGN